MNGSRSAALPRNSASPGPAHRRAASDAGFTIVEVLVATIVLTIGIASLFSNYISSQKLGTSAEAHQTAVALAERQLEKIRGLKWTEMALKVEPTREAGTPTEYEVTTETTKCAGNGPTSPEAEEEHCYEWNTEPATFEPLVICPATTLPATPTAACTSSGGAVTEDPKTVTVKVTSASSAGTRLTYKIYSFVTWAYDSTCVATKCSKGAEDPKRVVVAVTGSFLNKPVTLVSVAGDVEPAANPVSSSLKCTAEGGGEQTCVTQ